MFYTLLTLIFEYWKETPHIYYLKDKKGSHDRFVASIPFSDR